MNKTKLTIPLIIAAFAAVPLQANAAGLFRSGGVVGSLISIDQDGIKILSRSVGGSLGGRAFNGGNLRDRLEDIRDGDGPLAGLSNIEILDAVRRN